MPLNQLPREPFDMAFCLLLLLFWQGSGMMQLDKLEFDGGKEMFEELGISFGTALIVLIALYFVVKWAVKNGIKEAYKDITVKDTAEDIEAEEICNELGLNEEEK